MMWAKQSTAATLIIGPVLDSAGAEYASAVIGDLSISKNGGTLTAMAAAATLTHIANGQYTLVTTTANLDTLGRAQITCNKSTYQMPPVNLMVLPSTVFDALVTNAVNATGGLTGATGVITGLAGVIATTTNITAGTITTTTDLTNLPTIPANWITAAGINASAFTAAKFDTACLTDAKFATGAITATVLADGAITNAKFAAGAIDNAAIAADAIGSSELAATAVAEIADQVWDEILSGHAVAGSTGEALNAAGGAGDPWITAIPGAYGVGSAGYILGTNLDATVSSRASQTSLNTVDDFLDTEIAAIKAKTDNLPTDPADASDVAAAITVATSGLATAANLATVAGYLDTEIAAILADTNELQTDWANGGRLDLILDARASQTSVDDVPTNAELATAITTALTTALTEGYRATNATGSVRDLLYEILQNITEFTIASTTKTVKKLDGSTTAKTYTLNDGTTPTGITETT